MDNVEIKKSNLEAAYKQADDNTKKLLATLFGDAVTTKDDRPVTERIKTFEDAMAALDSNHPLYAISERFAPNLTTSALICWRISNPASSALP